ncbi:MAG: energy coupling factor transporter S component ThiW [Lachnospiraceae bacterium]|nr:energy coupling factor transporter S component ThiW [Lachnospiraceae bacterium]MDY6334348.1 energy coupling factor transporter S component ThiW [Lachnospiraceae bacterium]
MNKNIRKLVVSGMLTAVVVVLSPYFTFPVFGSKCAPLQHMVNVFAAVLLGPFWGVGIAFCISLIRNLIGTGTLLAFPGSMIGALLCGVVYWKWKKLVPTYFAEVLGTGVIGGMVCFPVAKFLMGNETAALFTFVVPFLISTAGGTILAAVLIGILKKSGALGYLKGLLEDGKAEKNTTARTV